MFRGSLQALDGVEAYGRVVVFASVVSYDELTAGRPVTFRARIGRPTRRDLTVAVLSATGEPTIGQAPGWQRLAAGVRAEFSEAARTVLPADQAAMLPALVLGDTSALPSQTDAEFRSAGLTHLTAVSGANVTIVCGAVLLSAAVIGPRAAAAAAAARTDCVRRRGSTVGERAARRGDGRHHLVRDRVAPATSGGACAVGQCDRADDRRAGVGRRPRLRAVGGGHGRARRDCAGLVSAARRPRLAQAAC